MKIIARYITKEVILTFFAITGILLLIAISNRFAMYLAKAATGEFPIKLVFQLVGLYVPELLSFLIPLGFFLAILFAYGRLHADSEMTVLSACGMSWSYLSRITLVLALIVMIITAWLVLWVVPSMTLEREKSMSEGEALAVIHSMLPGRFQMFGDGRLVFYLEDIQSKDNRLKGVFIAEQPEETSGKNGWTLITAKEAQVEKEKNTKDFYLVLNDGYRYQGTPGEANYHIIKFDNYGRSVKQDSGLYSNDILRAKQSKNLLHSSLHEDTAELQWRLSIPLSVPILALLAIPLAQVRQRQGKFAKFLPAIILYIIYYNLFTVSKRWVATQSLSSFIGVWWVHLIFLLLASFLLAKESGWLRMKLNRKRD